MRPPIRHFLWVLATFCVLALPLPAVRSAVANGYCAVANNLFFDHLELGRGGRARLAPVQDAKATGVSYDTTLNLGTRRKPNVVTFGVSVRRDAYLPGLLALLIPLCAPTQWTRRLYAAALSGLSFFVLSLFSLRAIAAWYFLVHGANLMVYLQDARDIKLAKLFYKAVLSQPNYRLALAAGIATVCLWAFGYASLSGRETSPSPIAGLWQKLRSLVGKT